MAARRSFWAWGMETDEPSQEERDLAAGRLSKRYGRVVAGARMLVLSKVQLKDHI